MFVQLLLLCVAVSIDGLGAGFSYGARNLRIPFLSLMVISLSSALTMGLAMFLGWAFKHYVSLYLARLLGGGILIVLGCWIAWQGLNAGLKKGREARPNRNGQYLHIKEGGKLPGLVKPNLERTVDLSGSVAQANVTPDPDKQIINQVYDLVDVPGRLRSDNSPGQDEQNPGQSIDSVRTEKQSNDLQVAIKQKSNYISDPVETGKRLNYLQFLPKIIFEPQKADLDHSGIINLGEAALLGFALACDAFGAGFAAALAGFNLWLTSFVVGLSKFFLISLGFWGGSFFRERLSALPAHLFSGGLLIFLGLLNIL